MKVDSETSSEPCVDSLSISFQLLSHSETSGTATSDSESGTEEKHSSPFRKDRFTRLSRGGLAALQNLPGAAPLVLFTPFLTPAGSSDTAQKDSEHQDPFESFGRKLAKYHANIRHVPYVPATGFTRTHLQFVWQSQAVITVICEPNHPHTKESMSKQHEFAESALKEFALRPTELPRMGEFVLVQCGTEEVRQCPWGSFTTVLDTGVYNDKTATFLADTIFGWT